MSEKYDQIEVKNHVLLNVCRRCGALVISRTKHNKWHNELAAHQHFSQANPGRESGGNWGYPR